MVFVPCKTVLPVFRSEFRMGDAPGSPQLGGLQFDNGAEAASSPALQHLGETAAVYD